MTGFMEGEIYQKYSAKSIDIQNYINYNIIIADIIQQKNYIFYSAKISERRVMDE